MISWEKTKELRITLTNDGGDTCRCPTVDQLFEYFKARMEEERTVLPSCRVVSNVEFANSVAAESTWSPRVERRVRDHGGMNRVLGTVYYRKGDPVYLAWDQRKSPDKRETEKLHNAQRLHDLS